MRLTSNFNFGTHKFWLGNHNRRHGHLESKQPSLSCFNWIGITYWQPCQLMVFVKNYDLCF